MDIHVYEIDSKSAASGTWSANTLDIHSGICSQIVLMASASAMTFDFKLTDEKGIVVYDTILREKTATWILYDNPELPMHGVYTMKVYNASSDGMFNGRLLIRDQ